MRRSESQMWTVSWLLFTGLMAAGGLGTQGYYTLTHFGLLPVSRGAIHAFEYDRQPTPAATSDAPNRIHVVEHAKRAANPGQPAAGAHRDTHARTEALVLLLLAAEGGRSTIR